ncbi:MAG: amidohydrolase [Hominenteromicrobium sp.]
MRTTYYNGAVYTGGGWADSFTVENGTFIWVGQYVHHPADTGRTVDLGGRFVCAGFNDSHMHLLNLGHVLSMAQLSAHTDSLSGMLDYLRSYIAETGPAKGSWVLGRGFNHDYFRDEPRFPTRRDLDRVSTAYPICITRACGHICVVNSTALAVLGINRNTPQPEGGRIALDENGEPNGQFFENALNLVMARMPVPDMAEIKRMLRLAAARLNRFGITSCHSDDYEAFPNIGYKTVMTAIETLADAGELTVRVNEQAQFTTPGALRGYMESGDFRHRSACFTSGPLKMIGDGSLGAHTAYLSRPYADAPETRGMAIYTQDQLDEMIDCANRGGMSVAVHAIGDATLDRVLDAIEKALAACPRADHRHGIVHCQITRADQLERIRKLRLHVYTQSIFLDYDTKIVRARVGDALAETSYAAKSLLSCGASVSNGSDSPVEAPDVLRGIECAVTRRSVGSADAPYRPEEALSVQEAIDTFTQGGAYASFEERIKGRIAAHMLADFVVLERNPFETAPEHLHEIAVLETYLGGKCVYRKA